MDQKNAGTPSAKTYQRKNTYIHRTVAGNEVLIFVGGNIGNFNGYIQLNASALCLWEKLAQPCTEEQLKNALTEAFHIPEDQAAEDVRDFLKELKKHDMMLAF